MCILGFDHKFVHLKNTNYMYQNVFTNIYIYVCVFFCRTTADIEGFHQLILMYCAKRFAYTPPVYRARNILAAIDHNMHCDRPMVHHKDGSLRYCFIL